MDSNIFVYHMARDPRHGDRATSIIRRVEEGEHAATSILIIAQVCGYLRWRRRPEAIPVFLAFLRSLPNLMKVDTTFADFVEGENLRVRYDIDCKLWDDLTVIAQMTRLGIDEIYSNDVDFDTVPGVRRVFE